MLKYIYSLQGKALLSSGAIITREPSGFVREKPWPWDPLSLLHVFTLPPAGLALAQPEDVDTKGGGDMQWGCLPLSPVWEGGAAPLGGVGRP